MSAAEDVKRSAVGGAGRFSWYLGCLTGKEERVRA